ncbi:hypothetical protein [Micromonospora sp. KC721]|uniref:hypothetical protein n=1 Tax=Micromonospora sp. KC721 TaxID=2530380 RepID=UPI001053FC29|nr:hypothetical protein [Micromonospora sp. KC721]TDB80959.1 hypothetical protein E1182_07105 [Micromonospora sp. KC721]
MPVKAIAEAVLDRVLQMGLTSRLRPATVVGAASGSGFRVVVDGDTVPMRVGSLVGALPKKSRVMVLMTPPAGNHVVGFLGVPPQSAYLADTGVVVDKLALLYEAGWAAAGNSYRIVGSRIELSINLTRTGAAITASALGNITDTLIVTLSNRAFRPSITKNFMFRSSVTSGAALLSTSGQVILLDMHPTSSISTNDTVRLSVDYLLPVV